MPAKIFDADSTAKLKRLIEEGMQVKQEVSDLNAGLRETVKALSMANHNENT